MAQSAFTTRGVVLLPFDLSLADWPRRAAEAGLTTIGLHAARRLDVLSDWIRAEPGEGFRRSCAELGLHVEYELHAVGELLSREYYALDPTMFRLDAGGRRNPDANCCPSSPRALEIIAASAARWAQVPRPTTGRYFLWPDDGHQWCACPACAELTSADQALLVENAMLRALRGVDPAATLAHLAYAETMAPPRSIRPEPGIFLEFAPIRRAMDQPIAEQAEGTDTLAALAANLAWFGSDGAQVLEYWLDVSLHSGWDRPAKPLPWRADVVRADLAAYAALGVRAVTTFACYLDADYVARYGEPAFVAEYGQLVSGSRP